MRLRLVVVGRGAPELAAFEARLTKRLHGMTDFQLVELAEGKAKQPTQRKQQEQRHIMQQVNDAPYVLFDERGVEMASTDWAACFARQHGAASMCFVIGGADGVDASVRQGAAETWSLSRLTLPHQMARLLAIEQFYRALSINQGHPYHRP
jgi:23S rRNA (pseudouridine1915-N3)-methyltransferase